MSRRPVVGVVGAGRVGAVLSAALRAAGHEVVAVAGESDASRARIETLLPGVPVDKPTRRRARLRPAAADRPRRHARQRRRRCCRPAARSGAGQHVVHTSGRHGLAVLQPAADLGAQVLALHPAMTFTGTDARPGPAAGLRVRRHRRPGHRTRSRGGSSPTSAAASSGCPRTSARSTTQAWRTAPTTWSRWSPRRWTCSARPAPSDPAATLRPLLNAALDNALSYGRRRAHRPDRPRRRRDRPGPPRRHRASSARDARVLRRAGPRHREHAPSSTAGCCRSGPPSSSASSTTPWTQVRA